MPSVSSVIRGLPFLVFGFAVLVVSIETQGQTNDGSVLPFAPAPMESVVKPRLQDSSMKWPDEPSRLPSDAPNILIVLVDDVGFGISDAFGGEVQTPALSKLAKEGIRYNAFHTTSICSPTRASLLTGRNHTRVGSGTIAERAVAFDGYTGIIPKEAATIAEVLKAYGYHTSAFGKWHNTPATETTSIGPKDRWPNGYGFEHFYGFLGGETSREPRLFENYDAIEPPVDDPEYHLSVDMKERALKWIDEQQAFSPDKPFFMYWAPGAVHGPHHVAKEWADRYKGKFDDGWDAYRERVFQRQLDSGIIPAGTKLTARDATMPAWDSVPEAQKEFQLRLMEVFAGFVTHTDEQIGALVDGLEERGLRDNTLIFYIFGDNGSSAEGQQGSISELLAQNGIPNTIDQQIAAMNEVGGIEAIGGPEMDNMYHSGWAWAGATPFRSTKLVAAHFGGTRNPMVVSWPKKIEPDATVRTQFHHVVDVAPTIYELLDIELPEVVNGYKQMEIDGNSFAYTFSDALAKGRTKTQFFDNNGSRGIYHDGWFASAFGPFTPWRAAEGGFDKNWDSATDTWQLYDLKNDFSQATDVASDHPERLQRMQELFLDVASDNKDFPIGAGNWLRLHPADIHKPNYRHWKFGPNIRRMPEFSAPGLGKQSSRVTLDFEIGDHASGVLYALGGASGGLSLYLDEGHLVYEYNLMIIERYRVRSEQALAAGEHRLVVDSEIAKPGAPGRVSLELDGQPLMEVDLKRTVPLAFTATDTFDVGVDLGSPVSPHYAERRPFEFEGSIGTVEVELTD
ncbi:MAG: arylsulfatase [Rubripirellula sp.]